MRKYFTLLLMVFSFQGILYANEGLEIVKKSVDSYAKDYKSQFEEQYKNKDWSILLQKKETFDSYLLPVFLLYELEDANKLSLCDILRYDYSDTSNELIQNRYLLDKEMVSLYKNFLMSPLQQFQGVSFDVRVTRNSHRGSDYPLSLSMSCYLSKNAGTICVKWYEPYLANRHLNFPNHPENQTFLISKNKDLMQKNKIVFDNDIFFYNFNDSLKILPIILSTKINIANIDNKSSQPYIQVTKKDGQVIKKMDIGLVNGSLERVKIFQNSLKLPHISPDTIVLSKNVEGCVIEEKYRPESQFEYLKNGRTIDIYFNNKTVKNKQVLMPVKITISIGSNLIYEVEYTNFEFYEAAEKAARTCHKDKDVLVVAKKMKLLYEAIDNNRTDFTINYFKLEDIIVCKNKHLSRAMLKYNIYGALKYLDRNNLRSNLETYREYLLEEGLGVDFYIYSLEALSQLSFDYMGAEQTKLVTFDVIYNEYNSLSTKALLIHLGRLLDQARLGHALLAIDILKSRNFTVAFSDRLSIISLEVVGRIKKRDSVLYMPNDPYADRLEKLNYYIFKNRK